MIYFLFFIGVVWATFLIFTTQILPNKLNIWKVIAISLGLTLYSLIQYLLQIEVGTPIFLLINLFAIITVLILPILFYEGEIWKRYVVFIFFIVLIFLCEMTSEMLIFIINDGVGVGEISFGKCLMHISQTYTVLMWIHGALFLALYILFGSVAVVLWRMITARKFKPFFLLIFIFPIGQLMFLLGELLFLPAFWLLGIFISLIASLVLLVYIISLEKKAALEEELRETRHVMELEQSHYRELEQKREEFAKIRHDFNNQLASIGQLIRQGQEELAEDMVKTLAAEISKTNENPYCAIPIINGILTEKAKLCAEVGIDFTVELNLPNSLAVEQIHLCSIFGNLLDNAINACRQKIQGKPKIQLNTKVDGDYLFIQVVNTSEEPQSKPAPDRGYGTRILSELAARYDGDYCTEYKNGIFIARVSLLAVGEAG